jgi:hypothetical protein
MRLRHKAKSRVAFGFPSVRRELLNRRCHGREQIGAGVDALAVDDLPLQPDTAM